VNSIGNHRGTKAKYLADYEALKASIKERDFTDKPLEELKFVVSSNLNRRYLDEFQKAHVAIKYDKLYRKISLDRYRSSQFKPDTASKAISKRYKKEQEEFSSSLRGASGDADRSLPEESSIDTEPEPVERKSSAELAQQFGISESTVETTPASGHTTAADAKQLPAHLRNE
jgi:hypothetical protein